MTHPVEIRFADIDMAGHVHNAAYLHYFETARLRYFAATLGENWDWNESGFILKKNEIIYHAPVYLTEKVHLVLACAHIGNSSFTLTYSIQDERDQVRAEGLSVVVCFNYKQNKKIPIPEELLLALQKLQPSSE